MNAFRRFVPHLAAAFAMVGVGACLAQGGGVLPHDREEDAGAPPVHFLGDASSPDDPGELPELDPHAVRGVDPGHGPFSGGQRAIVRGAGFTSEARVWFGDTEVNADGITPIDPRRIQVVVPPGPSGPVDVKVQIGTDSTTARVAAGAYIYDSFFVSPTSGPLSGGTVITLYGQNTNWDESTTVTIDLADCEVVALRKTPGQPEELDCRTPPGTPGAKAVRVTTGDVTLVVLDAFLYGNSEDGFRGGLSGSPLSNRLRVLALSNATGKPIPGAAVALGSADSGMQVEHADADGHVAVEREGLGPTQTVTVAATCFMPVTFVDVPVDTVTAYLDPVLSPECNPEGDPPTVGGSGSSSSSSPSIEGEIVFPEGGIELRRRWTGPVAVDPNARRVAYVFMLDRDARRPFRLPDSAFAITPDSDGTVGYSFELTSGQGNLTLYALAGIENRELDPPLFTAYTMGLVSGVWAEPHETTSEVFIPMDITLDHALLVTVDGPTPTSRGPDRIRASVAVRYGNLGYVILPFGQKDSLLSATAAFDFVGLPPLIDVLTDADYVVSATADTGLSGSLPRSVIGLFSPPPEARSIALDGFIEVPRLESPGENGLWTGTDIVFGVAPGGAEANLTFVEVTSERSATSWSIVAPGTATILALPDPAQIAEMGLRAGPVGITVSRARIDGFDYGAVGYTELSARSWDAYATDIVQAHYE